MSTTPQPQPPAPWPVKVLTVIFYPFAWLFSKIAGPWSTK